MTNKLDKPRGDLTPADPSLSGPLVKKTNSDGQQTTEPSGVAAGPDPRAATDGSPPVRRLKDKSDVSMKNSSADLKARQDVIGAGLKRIFDEIVEEPVPPEFLELLEKIDHKREP